MFGLAAGTVAPSAWAGLWQAAVKRRGSLPKNALPRPHRAGCPQSQKTKVGLENQRRLLPPLLHPTPSPAAHPIPCIPACRVLAHIPTWEWGKRALLGSSGGFQGLLSPCQPLVQPGAQELCSEALGDAHSAPGVCLLLGQSQQQLIPWILTCQLKRKSQGSSCTAQQVGASPREGHDGSLVPACPQGGRLGLGTGVGTVLGSEGEGLVTDVHFLRKAGVSLEEEPRDAHSVGGLSTGAEA